MSPIPDFIMITVQSCACAFLPQVLLFHGLFPTAPSQSQMVVSVELLAFYWGLFEHSCNAVNALAHALHSHYTRRGYRMMDKNVSHSSQSLLPTDRSTGLSHARPIPAKSWMGHTMV